MQIECPRCDTVKDLDNETLSSYACDSVDVECANEDCGEFFAVGWYATAELR